MFEPPPLPQTNRRYLFVDMNAYFASCEQHLHPKLLGQPVAVTPSLGSSLTSVSYEAKALGIKNGMRAMDAQLACPSLRVIVTRHRPYLHIHQQIVKIVENLSPHVSVRSIDEVAIRLCRNEDPWLLGRQIKQDIARQIGPALRCSIGIGPNAWLAKLATDLEKPDGLVEVRLADLPTVYRALTLPDLPGINWRMARQLQRAGISTPYLLATAETSWLEQRFGSWGLRWAWQLRGYDGVPAVGLGSFTHRGGQRKSLSHSHVLPPTLRSPQRARQVLRKLVEKVGHHLREEQLIAHYTWCVIRFESGQNHGFGRRLSGVSSTSELWQAIWLPLAPAWRQPVKQIVVGVANLSPRTAESYHLFPEAEKAARLSRAADDIHNRFGVNALQSARLLGQTEIAADKITFQPYRFKGDYL